MRILLQRVSRAEVLIRSDDGKPDHIAGQIGTGFLLLAGFTHSDGEPELQWMVEKIIALRLFSDTEGKMNLGLTDVQGALLIVSQFTLYGDASKGRRPSFLAAARPEIARPLYERFTALFRSRGLQVETGIFGAHMDVALINEGPVTLWLEREATHEVEHAAAPR
ncbi:MAG: D-aminoacyl-tRNA deacylase [Gemmatimonadota bacterium]|nr:D-aminoacyl-tRNA deacylase [Gemmatimonadota bacterium]